MSTTNTPSLLVENLSVRYGETVALDAVDLCVEAGEVVAVLGPSGCGKSTLLRAVAGLEPLSGGRIIAQGVDLSKVPTHERGLGLMFQDHALFPHETVAGNIAFGLRMAGASSAEQGSRVAELLELVDLVDYADRPVSQLSGGEAQRVALARSLAPAPALLMLDEPLGSLDRVLREQLTGELRTMLGHVGVSALHVTHDQAEAFAIADRVMVMRDGRIEQVGSPETIWHEPANRFVAEFLGHPNVWTDDGSTVIAPITALLVDPAGSLEVEVSDAVFVDGRFRVTSVATADAPTPGASQRTVVFEHPERLKPGERLRLHLDSQRIRTLAD